MMRSKFEKVFVFSNVPTYDIYLGKSLSPAYCGAVRDTSAGLSSHLCCRLQTACRPPPSSGSRQHLHSAASVSTGRRQITAHTSPQLWWHRGQWLVICNKWVSSDTQASDWQLSGWHLILHVTCDTNKRNNTSQFWNNKSIFTCFCPYVVCGQFYNGLNPVPFLKSTESTNKKVCIFFMGPFNNLL